MRWQTITIDDVGDMSAPPGSREWARAVQMRMWSNLREVSATAMEFESWASALQRHEGWKQLADKDGRPFPTYEKFCCAPPPFGLGYSVEDIDRIIGERRRREAREMAADPAVKPVQKHGGQKRGEKGVANGNSVGSNNASYLVRRLKRDHPEIAEALARGEYPSARAAAIAAGLVRVPTVLDLFARLWAKATDEERRAIGQQAVRALRASRLASPPAAD